MLGTGGSSGPFPERLVRRRVGGCLGQSCEAPSPRRGRAGAWGSYCLYTRLCVIPGDGGVAAGGDRGPLREPNQPEDRVMAFLLTTTEHGLPGATLPRGALLFRPRQLSVPRREPDTTGSAPAGKQRRHEVPLPADAACSPRLSRRLPSFSGSASPRAPGLSARRSCPRQGALPGRGICLLQAAAGANDDNGIHMEKNPWGRG
ncbi:uncharacterized protein LOC127384207 [Apus apus]|uniref:uncharacterized protein LOC127384207 n=1 Tax=Apus apus TaxID=8895 RepID=UPI0021F8A3A0|nr:uncharacterized protein LOC127384207 [Apus apus]